LPDRSSPAGNNSGNYPGFGRLASHLFCPMNSTRLLPGSPDPLGATYDGHGVNFAVFSEHASAVELCIFDNGKETRLPLPECTYHIHHGYLEGARPGLRYGYRVEGPFRPLDGLRFNRNKLLLDPYARHWEGAFKLLDEDFAYPMGHPDLDLAFDHRDNGVTAPKAIVVDTSTFDWEGDRHPRTPWSDTIIYEAHVKGLTKLHPLVPEALRGTYLGLATPPVIDHLKRLGVTAIELLPVHSIMDDRRLRELGLRNYWGYGTINYFRPAARYANGNPLNDFRQMVKQFHKAGLEVFVDVVYNHTGEGSHLGPSLSYRGIDNTSYYRVVPGQPRYYMDYTGCGNTLNTDHPQVLQLVMDSLRFWVEEMRVDGFRYDLAPALIRGRSSFLAAVHQDPTMRRTKVIAEPWDLGEGGYQAGNFPVRWSEWNDRYRDCLRRFWRGDAGTVGNLATRLCGSSDVYARNGKGPHASINFITCHDGFTLRDLVSYNRKHNLDNGENDRDGSNNNSSRNFGVEGETDDPAVRALRLRHQKSMLGCLMLSYGVPMLLGGDEMCRTQRGNNNAYCQDNEISWFDWTMNSEKEELMDFVRQAVQLRKRFRMMTTNHFPRPEDHVLWLHPNGSLLAGNAWNNPHLRSLGWIVGGEHEEMLLLVHAGDEDVKFALKKPWRAGWKVLLTSYEPVNRFVVPPGGLLVATRPLTRRADVEPLMHAAAARLQDAPDR
jgi:isoamylase